MLDIDPDFIEAWGALCDKHELPDAPTVQTGRGGYHLYFAWDSLAAEADVRTRKEVNGHKGLDTKAAGGYAIGPGSASEFGSYRWQAGWELTEELPLVPAPLGFWS